jgi:hypothetical protein
MRIYSQFFATLYDQSKPIGQSDHGDHYSVLRATSWHLPDGGLSKRPQHFDFGVIWDSDHDTRIISVIEEIYLAGFLSRFMLFSETKGIFTATLYHGCSFDRASPKRHQETDGIVRKTIIGDVWQTNIDTFGANKIDPRDTKAIFYANINALWKLGGKAIPPCGLKDSPDLNRSGDVSQEEPEAFNISAGKKPPRYPWP